jgi:hypothetical protein
VHRPGISGRPGPGGSLRVQGLAALTTRRAPAAKERVGWVGKSRLAEEFLRRTAAPALFFTASAQPSSDLNLRLFVQAAAGSGLPTAAVFEGQEPATWDAALRLLARALPTDRPLSTQPSREVRHQVDDPHLRFWLSFLGPNAPTIERGRGDLVLKQIRNSWTSWRGRAIEPVVREALWRIGPEVLPAGTDVIGGYWTRTNDPEIDLVGADRGPVAKKITCVGSIKWQEGRPFDRHDLARLHVHRSKLPGADETVPLIAVGRAGVEAPDVIRLLPEDLLAAWRSPTAA